MRAPSAGDDFAFFEGLHDDDDDDSEVFFDMARQKMRTGKVGLQGPPAAPPTGIAAIWQRLKRLNEGGVLVQGLGIPARHALALWGLSMLARGQVSRRTAGLAISLWIVSGLGVTAGAHRLWAHQSYHASPTMEWLLMIMFSVADQGPIRGWC